MNAVGVGRRRGSLILAGFVSLVGIAVLTGLGVWQLERKAWKEDLIARLTERVAERPRAMPAPESWSRLSQGDLGEEHREGADEAGDQDHEHRRPIAGIGLGQVVAAGRTGRGDLEEALEKTPLAAVRAAAAKPRQQRMRGAHIRQ